MRTYLRNIKVTTAPPVRDGVLTRSTAQFITITIYVEIIARDKLPRYQEI